ncbi:helix-turn-helix-type transcriptional regulator [Vibrio sp. HA2012]|uniref:MerR family transcriptional regulator n=1 Tax=Vibrio sp. HA2012 TaxID=1971595 RepID=UPI000C2C7ABB|nr:MerR family transcriptional regulator [Vibrio sp. HA2012]PJC86958.1 helix-turn-helix-type transcriptional regulator [Vibrio sp. HA2012]
MKLYAIREVAALTGIKPVTLRAWQRRYGLIQPQRSESGHRLYSEEHLERIRQIQNWLDKGVSVGKVRALLGTEEKGISGCEAAELEEVADLLEALASLNSGKADTIITNVLKEYPLSVAESQFSAPVERSLVSVKSSLRTLQKGLYQSLMNHHLYQIIDAENRASTKDKGKLLFISLDHIGSIAALYEAGKQAEKRFHVTFLDGAEDVSGIKNMSGLEQFNQLHLFANRTLPVHILKQIFHLTSSLRMDVICSGLIEL